MIDLVCVLVQQSALLGAGGELEHLLHHVHGELVPSVHRHYCPELIHSQVKWSKKYYSQRESFSSLSVIKSKYRGEWGCILYMRDVRWRLVKCTSLEHRVWLLWNWQFAGLIERSVLLFCDLSYSLNLRSWREKSWWCVGPRARGKNSFHARCQMRGAHVTGDTDFNWYELVTPTGAASRLMPHQSPIKTPLSLIHPALHVTLTVTFLLHDSPARHDKCVLYSLTAWSHHWTAWAWRGGWCSSARACCRSRRWFCGADPWFPSISGPLLIPRQTKNITPH